MNIARQKITNRSVHLVSIPYDLVPNGGFLSIPVDNMYDFMQNSFKLLVDQYGASNPKTICFLEN